MAPWSENLRVLSGVRLGQGHLPVAEVLDERERAALPWDRYVRLFRAAQLADKYLRSLKQEACGTVLDISGDGALALFLPQYKVAVANLTFNSRHSLDLSGANLIAADEKSFDVLVSTETLDHCPQSLRAAVLNEFGRVAQVCLVGYLRAASLDAERLVHEITQSRSMVDILECDTVADEFVADCFQARGLRTSFYPHTSAACWLAYSTLYGLNSVAGDMLSRYLIEHLEEEETKHPVYQLAFAQS
jgi:hypothetical protein